MNEHHPISYHLQSIRSAFVRQELGGVKAEDSHLMANSVSELMRLGLSEEEIIAAYRQEFHQ